MTENKRWGKEFKDKRDWAAYGDELVLRHMIYLDLDWVESWPSELIEMNRDKCGAPFRFPHSMIVFQSFFVEKFSTRGAEAITRKLQYYNLIPAFNDHATIHRRVIKQDLSFTIPKGKLHVGTDGSGMKTTNAGEYFQSTYGKTRRKFAKLIITATKDDILAVDVVMCEKDNSSEPEMAQKQITEIMNEGGTIEKVYDDGAFDKRAYFNFLEKHGIESAIRIRSNASTKAKGSYRRKREVILFKEKGYKDWAIEKHYGDRWILTEGHFSGIKRGYGDGAKAKKRENVLLEIKRKVWIYDKVRKYGRNRTNDTVLI